MREQRKHPRKAAGTPIRYRSLSPDGEDLDYLEGVVENVGVGGVFINTEDPLPRGSMVELQLRVSLAGQEKTIGAKALVKWNRRMFPPTGMGLEFVEFSGMGRTELSEWILQLTAPESV